MVAAASTPPDKRDAIPPVQSGNRSLPTDRSNKNADASMVAPVSSRSVPLTISAVPSASHSRTSWYPAMLGMTPNINGNAKAIRLMPVFAIANIILVQVSF